MERSIVLLDDNHVIREVVKKQLKGYKIYTTDNGVEGLGYIYLSKPDYIVIDTTLPKYGGLEVIEYLATNQTLRSNNTPIIVIYEGKEEPRIDYPNVTYISKSSKNFIEQLQEKLTLPKTRNKLGNRLIRLSNKSDEIQRRIKSNKLLWIEWIIIQILISIFLTVYTIVNGKESSDENLPQQTKDERALRVRYYPTIATAGAAFLFLIVQVSLFVTGGVVIFNTRITSIFAASPEVVINLTSSEFDNTKVENISGTLQLKTITTEIERERLQETEEPVSFPEELPTQQLETITSYIADKPVITFTEGVDYNNLKSILEESSINNYDSSLTSPLVVNQTSIKYQLSPDKQRWYYYGTEGWEETQQGEISSNTVQEVNEHLNDYVVVVGEGKVYIRIYLVSEGTNNVTLTNLKIVREYQDPNEDITLPIVSYPEEETLPEGELPTPVIYQATYLNGKKVVYGKLENIPEDLNGYEVNIYYTTSADISTNAKDKGELIGTTNLERNESNEVTFLLIADSTEGGYVVAELVKGEDFSNLSKPLENSTFSVDSTGDEVDASIGNGLCLTAGGKCTLRAAIAETNSLAGGDNIYFNIPTSDTGYRDYDTPDTVSSGDSVGGDDYWTIRPATALPTISQEIHIDGATQESNQGDKNLLGPDIEINTTSVAFTFDGLTLASTANASSVNSMVIRNFRNQIQVGALNGFTLTKSYLGTTANGLVKSNTNQQKGVAIDQATNVVIGNTRSDGNVFGGFKDDYNNNLAALDFNCGTTALKSITVRGNNFGLGSDGTTDISHYGENQIVNGILLTGRCSSIIGGSSEASRNIFGGLFRALRVAYSRHTDAYLLVENNFFGTDISGMLDRSNYIGIRINSGSSILGAQSERVIKNNLIISKLVYATGILIQSSNDVEVEGNTISVHIGVELDNEESSYPYDQINIKNNFISIADTEDPYFGKNTSYSYSEGIFDTLGIISRGGNPRLIGNSINGYEFGVFSRNSSQFPSKTYAAYVGGQGNLIGSLCGGSMKNCFSRASYISPKGLSYQDAFPAAITFIDTVPINDSTIFDDNIFNLPGTTVRISWGVAFELFSGNNRRTDLSDNSLSIPFAGIHGAKILTNNMQDYQLNSHSLNFYSTTCSVLSDCGSNASTTGILNKTFLSVMEWNLDWPSGYSRDTYISEYEVGELGEKTIFNNTIKFDLDHFSSKDFSFDGDSSTNNVLNDRGEYWSDNPTGTRDLEIANFTSRQIMEVEYVDANPVLQEDGSYVITVDSTTDENNVSTCGFDDGGGAYSGGGCGGPNGLPNGKTSLREAVIVANNHAGFEKIEFNIPTSDPNYVAPSGDVQGYFPITINSQINVTDDSGVFIDGYSQPGSSRNTASFGEPINTVLNIRVQSNDWYLNLDGDNNHIAGINFGAYLMVLSNNNHIEGNFMGSNINGTQGLTEGVLLMGSNSASNIIGTDGDGAGDAGERNLFSTNGSNPYADIDMLSSTGGNHIIAGNYIGTDRTGRSISTGNKIGMRIGVGGPNVRIGTNFDGISDSEEANIVASVTATPIALIGTVNNVEALILQGNYLGTNPYNDDLVSVSGIGSVLINNPVEGSLLRGNVISNSLSGGVWNQELSTTNNSGNTLRQNKIYNNESLGIALNNNTEPTPNDTGDSDTGPNNLMNYPTIEKVTYMSGGTYKVEGILDNNVVGEGPFDIEICESDNHVSNHGGCVNSLGYFENEITQVAGGLNPYSVEVTIAGDNGTQNRIFTSLATNSLGSTSEFSQNYLTSSNPSYSFATYPVTLVTPTTTTDSITPTLDWNANNDLDLVKYEVYLDGNKIGETTYNVTEYKVTTPLTGEHKWKVVGKRVTTDSGESIEQTFKVEPSKKLTLVSPVNVTIDTKTPTLDWNAEEGANTYEIYLDGVFNKSVTETEYKIEEELEEGDHTWQIVAFYRGVDNTGKEITTELGRSEVASFTIELAKILEPTTDYNAPVSYPQTTVSQSNLALQRNVGLVVVGIGIISIVGVGYYYIKKQKKTVE